METNFSFINKSLKNQTLEVLNNLTNSSSVTSDSANSTAGIAQEIIHQNFLSAKTLIAIIILLVHTIAQPIFEKIHFHYIHESGISMLLGMIVGLFSLFLSPTVKFKIIKNPSYK